MSCGGRKLCLLLAAAILGLLPRNGEAAILKNPDTYVILSDTHVFVMLSSLPVGQDGGRYADLPGEPHCDLRKRYRVSGLYAIGSSTPEWTVTLSAARDHSHLVDNRYFVVVNGSGPQPIRGPRTWAVKFFDQGREIQTRFIGEIVDYPSLAAPGGWIRDFNFREYELNLSTSSRESYVFDVRTGEITSQRRVWRSLLGWLMCAGLVISAVLVSSIVSGGWRRIVRGLACCWQAAGDRVYRRFTSWTISLKEWLWTVTTLGIVLGISLSENQKFRALGIVALAVIAPPALMILRLAYAHGKARAAADARQSGEGQWIISFLYGSVGYLVIVPLACKSLRIACMQDALPSDLYPLWMNTYAFPLRIMWEQRMYHPF